MQPDDTPAPNVELAPGSAAPQAPQPTRDPHSRETVRPDWMYWPQWQGSIEDVIAVVNKALDSFRAATSVPPTPAPVGDLRLEVSSREREYQSVEALRDALHDAELSAVDYISFRVTDPAITMEVTVTFSSVTGASLRVQGENELTVAGVHSAVESELDKGRRWTQRVGQWPHHLAFWAEWTAILGLALAILIKGDTGLAIGLPIVLVGMLMQLPALIQAWLMPRLVPPLELLAADKQETIAARWRGGIVKAGAAVLLLLAGAVINGLTGFLF